MTREQCFFFFKSALHMLATSHYLNVLFAWFLFCSLKPSVRIEFDLQKLNGNASEEYSVKKTIKKLDTVHLLTQHTLYLGVNVWIILHIKKEDSMRQCCDCINTLLFSPIYRLYQNMKMCCHCVFFFGGGGAARGENVKKQSPHSMMEKKRGMSSTKVENRKCQN